MPETPCPLGEATRRYPDRTAVVSAESTLSFHEYDARASVVAAWLEAEGLRRGDRLAILLESSAWYLTLLMGCFRAGLVACPLSPRLPDEGLRAAMETAGCARLVAGRETPGAPPLLAPDALERAVRPLPVSASIDLDQPATVVFTSGSSGRAKAALHSYGNHYHNALASNRNIELTPGDRWLLSLPLYHVSGLGTVFRCLLAGATVAIPAAEESLEEALRRYGATHASVVTTQLHRLVESDETGAVLSGMKAVLLGGSGWSRSLVQRALDRGVPLRTSYGLTEMASQVATTRAGDRTPERLDSAPPLWPDSVRIDEDGEIRVQGPTLFLGYLNGDEVERPLTPDGWFSTGDRGRLDDEGRLHVLGRRDNMLISGGENIQPEEIERELCRTTGVLQAVVVGVESAEYGRRPVAFVRMEAGAAPDGEALRAALQQRLPRFKIPDAFHPWPAHLDRPGMKLKRSEFTAEAESLSRLAGA